MIRFVDFGNQLDENGSFGFFDTIVDRFVSLGGHEFVSETDLRESADGMAPELIDRCARLIPPGKYRSQEPGAIPMQFKTLKEAAVSFANTPLGVELARLDELEDGKK